MEKFNLCGRSVTLRPMNTGDLQILFEFRNSFDFREYCSLRKNIISFDEFKTEIEKDLLNDRREQLVIESTAGEVIGTIFLYALSKLHRNAFVTIFISENFKHKWYGAESFGIYVDYVIKKYNLHKISVDFYSNNIGIRKMLDNANFIQEGHFKEQRKGNNGAWLDIFRFSLFKKNSQKIQDFLNKRTAKT